MDLDGGLIFRITQGKDKFDEARRLGVTQDVMAGLGKVAFGIIEKHLEEHGSLPGLEFVENLCGTRFKEIEADLGWIVEEIFRRDLFNDLKEGVAGVEKSLERIQPEEALKRIEQLAELARRKRVSKVHVQRLMDLGDEVITQYKRTKDGVIGVPMPWPSLNEMTMGLWPGTLTFFAARPGVGKTFAIVIICLHAWKEGYRVLLVSPEMSAIEIAERAFSIQTRTSYRDVVSGALGEFAEKRFFEGVMTMKGMEGFYIIDADEQMEPRAIEDVIDEVAPDVVGIDSAYMLRTAPGNRYERMVATVDWLRGMAKRKKVPTIALSQFRKLDSKRGGSLDDFAMTDTIAWDAHNLFGLHQDEDMKADKVMEFKGIKVRRQAFQRDLKVNWDFEMMNFEEIGAESSGFTDHGFEDQDVPF